MREAGPPLQKPRGWATQHLRADIGGGQPPIVGTLELLGEGKAAEFFGGFDPFLDDDFYVGESFLVGLSIGGAAGKFGDFGDKRFVGLTPIDDDFVSRHQLFPPSGN